MDMWNLVDLDAPAGTRDPIVLHSGDGARAVMIKLDAGQALGDHEVKERAWVTVVEGEVRATAGDDEQRCGVGTLLTFAPGERHSLVADGGARILLLLAPWPGEGHYRGEEMAL
ncbi:MAG: cupin domain-containing protein [Actinobacteria bacterium]|nr:MAG: cupin domain-containing protein [Actinomycetota bacterium]